MKKLFLGVLAIATMVACAKEDVISQNNEAIGFKQAFVDNSVRSVVDPSISKDNLDDYDFSVYAFVEKSPLLTNEKVYDADGAWTYNATQYWIYGANYNFCAIAPNLNASWTVNNTNVSDTYNATFTIDFTNDGTEDLLFANAGKIQGQEAGQNGEVGFTFGHLLSKVKFTFFNGYNASNATLRVKEIKIENAYTTATATVVASNANLSAEVTSNYTVDWSAHGAGDILDFGNATANDATSKDALEQFGYKASKESYNAMFLIPGAVPTQTVNQENVTGYKVTFKVDLMVGTATQPVRTYEHTSYVNFTPVAGYSYNIKAEITAKNIDPAHQQDPIVFTVNGVNGWTEKQCRGSRI